MKSELVLEGLEALGLVESAFGDLLSPESRAPVRVGVVAVAHHPDKNVVLLEVALVRLENKNTEH